MWLNVHYFMHRVLVLINRENIWNSLIQACKWSSSFILEVIDGWNSSLKGKFIIQLFQALSDLSFSSVIKNWAIPASNLVTGFLSSHNLCGLETLAQNDTFIEGEMQAKTHQEEVKRPVRKRGSSSKNPWSRYHPKPIEFPKKCLWEKSFFSAFECLFRTFK